MQNCYTCSPDRSPRVFLREHVSPVLPTVLTTHVSMDVLKSPSAQAEEDLPSSSRRVGRDPPPATRNNSGTATTTINTATSSRARTGTLAGHVAKWVPYTKDGPSSNPEKTWTGSPHMPTQLPFPPRFMLPRNISAPTAVFVWRSLS